MNSQLDISPIKQCIGGATRKASRALTSVYDRALAPHNIRISQFSLLAALHLRGATSLGELAKFMELDRTTLTRNLDLLEQKQWVRSRPADGDSRSRILTITDEGRAVVFSAFPAWQEAQDRIAAVMRNHDLSLLGELAKITPG